VLDRDLNGDFKMKKRNYLIPVVTLVAAITTNASATVYKDTAEGTNNALNVSLENALNVSLEQTQDFVITNSDNTQKFAYHYSHRSHASHSSHSSHYSGYNW
jgi:hypothetical protein